jgi:hypothetical protein
MCPVVKVYITRPIRLEGENLKEFLTDKGILHKDETSGEVKEPIGKFLDITTISSKEKGPLLMMFDLKTQDDAGKGVIATLTGDEALGKLFDVTGISVRVLRCSAGSYQVLAKYAAELSE